MEQTGREGNSASAEPGTHLHPSAQPGRAEQLAGLCLQAGEKCVLTPAGDGRPPA